MIKHNQLNSFRKFNLSNVVPALNNAGFNKKATNIYFCGSQKHLAICNSCKSVFFNGSNTCKDRFCAVCNKKRSLMYLARIYPYLCKLLDEGYYINVINYTIKDVDNLSNGIQLLNDSFRMLTHDNKTYRNEYNRRFCGGIKSLEVKIGANSNLWHPHFHSIVVKKTKSSDFEWLKSAWEDCTSKIAGTTEKVGSVWLKGFSSKNKHELLKSVLETLKYITKFDWNVQDKVIELVNTLSGVRSINTYGILRKIPTNVEDDISKSYTELVKQVCTNCGCTDFELVEYLESDYLQVNDFN